MQTLVRSVLAVLVLTLLGVVFQMERRACGFVTAAVGFFRWRSRNSN